MAPENEIGPKEEYQSLRQELLESKRYVFERPLLIAAVGTAAMSAFRDIQTAPVPFIMAGLLLFNLWFTVNRLQSAGRIIAYIQLQLEERRIAPWKGWETCLRDYRKWIKRPRASKIVADQLDWEAVPDALLYYPAIYQLHIGIALLALAASSFLALQSPTLASTACWVGTVLLTLGFALSAIYYRPAKLRTSIERNRVIWTHVLKGDSLKETSTMTGNSMLKGAWFFPLGAPWRSKHIEPYVKALETRFGTGMGRGVDYLHRILDRQINKARGLLTYNALLFASMNAMIIAGSPRGTVPVVTPLGRLGLFLALTSCIPLLFIFYLSWGTASALESDASDFSVTLLTLRRRTYLLTLSIYATLIATVIALYLVTTLTGAP